MDEQLACTRGTPLGADVEVADARSDPRLAWRCEELRRIGGEKLPTGCEGLLAYAIAEDAVAPDADEAVGQNVLEVALHEGGGIQAHRDMTFAALRITAAEGDGLSRIFRGTRNRRK